MLTQARFSSFHEDIKDVAKRGMRTLGMRNDPEPHVLDLYTPRFVKGSGISKEGEWLPLDSRRAFADLSVSLAGLCVIW